MLTENDKTMLECVTWIKLNGLHCIETLTYKYFPNAATARPCVCENEKERKISWLETNTNTHKMHAVCWNWANYSEFSAHWASPTLIVSQFSINFNFATVNWLPMTNFCVCSFMRVLISINCSFQDAIKSFQMISSIESSMAFKLLHILSKIQTFNEFTRVSELHCWNWQKWK